MPSGKEDYLEIKLDYLHLGAEDEENVSANIRSRKIMKPTIPIIC